jgi:hypothetical protein
MRNAFFVEGAMAFCIHYKFISHHHRQHNIIANFITSSIHLLTSSERMHCVFTIFPVFSASQVIVNVTFDNQLADVIVDIAIFGAIHGACERHSSRSIVSISVDDCGKIGDFEFFAARSQSL